ncbi:amidase [Candidatus Nitrosocosmicus franklandus]|nr:amidase [Candidatus Nitrosocosmicus franklandus]
MSLVDIIPQLKKGLLSPVDLVNKCLFRIKKLNSILNSFITVIPEEILLSQAKESERLLKSNEYRGPLHGIPFSVKDLIHVRDVKFTAGSRYYSDYVSKDTAAVVEKLTNAGAILVGTNNMNELASGITGKNVHFGDSKNPFDPSRISGGSSGGSAVAVATGMVVFSIGTDTGGSVRVPSSFCGVVGMKPTYGTISMSGILPLSPSLDHIGIITRKTIDSQIIHNVLNSSGRYHSPKMTDFTRSRFHYGNGFPKLLKLLCPSNHFLDILDKEIRYEFFNLISLLKSKGIEVLDVHLSLTAEYYKSWKTVRLYEAFKVHFSKMQIDSGHLSEEVRNMLLKGSRIDRSTYLNAKNMIRKIRNKFLGVFDRSNRVLLLPTTVIRAPRLRTTRVTINDKNKRVRDLLLRNTIVFNSIGFPALTIPLFKSDPNERTIPIGLQLVSAPYKDDLVFETGICIEKLTCNKQTSPR